MTDVSRSITRVAGNHGLKTGGGGGMGLLIYALAMEKHIYHKD